MATNRNDILRLHDALPAPPMDAAKAAGLSYVAISPPPPGIRRLRHGKGFRYLTPEGATVRDAAALRRIRALAIPPAWTDVWICPSPLGHIQAFGRDARGRKQYRYHAKWRDVRDETKYGQLVAFGRRLPAIRRRVRADLARTGIPREKVLAVVVELLDRTMMRVGNEEYARANGSYGLTTLRGRHVRFPAGALELRFRGKSGKEHRVRVDDRRIVRVVKDLNELPGQELFQYVGDDGARQTIDSADVNAYLRDIAGDDVSAKVFRTWAGTVRALAAMRKLPAAKEADTPAPSATATKRTLVEIVKHVAGCLGNTPAVCRKGYIHPAVLDGFQKGTLPAALDAIATRAKQRTGPRGLDADERLTLAFLADAQAAQARRPSLIVALRRSVVRAKRAARPRPEREPARRIAQR